MQLKHMELHIRLMRFFCIFNDFQTPFAYTFYQLYTFIFIGPFFMLFNVSLCMNLYQRTDDLIGFVSTAYVILSSLGGQAKVMWFLAKWRTLKHLILEMNAHEVMGATSTRPGRLVADFRFRTKTVLLAIFGLHMVMWLGMCVGPQFFVERALPFPAWTPYDWTEERNYRITYLYQTVSVFYGIHFTALLDVLTYSMLAFIALRCDLLVARIEKDGVASGHDCNARLIALIEDYSSIVNLKQRASVYISVICFVQFVACLLSTCTTLFYLNILIQSMSSQFISVAIYQLAVFAQLYLYCSFGNETIIKSSNIAVALYNWNWTECPLMFKKNLLLFMIRSQKPLKITALEFMDLSLDTCKAIMKTSWSYFMVLNRVYGPTVQEK